MGVFEFSAVCQGGVLWSRLFYGADWEYQCGGKEAGFEFEFEGLVVGE